MAQDSVILNITSTNGFSLSTSVIKDVIRISKTAKFAQQPIINRSSPIITYANSDPIMVDMNLEFKAITAELTTQDVNNIAKGLMSLTFPVKSGINSPPVCTITLGTNTLLKKFQCVCTSCTPAMGEDNVWDSDGNPSCITVSLQFMGFELIAQDASDFASNAIAAYKNLSF